MYSWLKSDGTVLQTDTIKQFCEITGFRPDMARTLASGVRYRLCGWCSTSKKPKVRKARERFTTVLVNTKTGEKKWLGPSVKQFARDHGLCFNELSQLINGHALGYRSWVLQKTLDAANGYLPGKNA